MSRRDNDGGQIAASGDGEDEGVSREEDLSPEDEFRDWVGEAEHAVAPDEPGTGKGWLGRVFGRSKTDDSTAGQPEPDTTAVQPEPLLDRVAGSQDPRDSADPETLSVFAAVSTESEDAETPDAEIAGLETGDTDIEAVETDAVETDAVETDADTTEAVDIEAVETEADTTEAGVSDTDGDAAQPSFAGLWESSDDDDDTLSDDIADFSTFTSEDYLQATTREYAGLAEAVARAEEEGTEQIAVSAEIPGLESGLVGLDDVVSAAGEDPNADVIAPPATSDLSMRVLTAVGLLIVFAGSLLSPYGIGALIVVVLAIAAGELYAAFIRSGYRPLSIFGFLGIAGAFFGTWIAGPVAIPMALLLTVIAVFLFYATVPGRRSALDNATVTILVAAWIGGLGGFAFDFLGSPDYRWLILAVVITVALMDVSSYFVGRRLGRRSLAPQVSPKKTVEGYVAGIIVAIGVGAAFGLAEPFDVADGLLIGAVIAIVAPVGDLAVSVLKRALGVKDMGYILPGHGGVLDRVDAMIMTIPAAWIAYSWMGLLS